MNNNLNKAKQADIIEFLEERGSKFKRRGSAMVCSSPFSSDSTPSFYVYPDNLFKCYSTGHYGDIIDLIQELLGVGFQDALKYINGNDIPQFEKKKYEKYIKVKKPFVLDNFIVNNLRESIQIDNYAKSRKIFDNYERCFYYVFNEITNEFDRKLAIGFVHTCPNAEIIGVKMRNIIPEDPLRYTARGRIGLYLIDVSTLDIPKLVIVEGEINCNSMAAFFKSINYSAIVVSFGGVGIGKKIAISSVQDFMELDTFIVIDEDGDKKMYKERLERYKVLNGTPINLGLPKGDDINSLWVDGNVEILNKLII